MVKRVTKNKGRRETLRSQELDTLRAENLRLSEELERLKLRGAGAHPAAAMAEAMKDADEAADSADEAVTMYASSMLVRSELLSLLAMLKGTVADFEQRLESLDHRAEFPLKAMQKSDLAREVSPPELEATIDLRDDAQPTEAIDAASSETEPAAKGA